jgi:AcrR family transcriptional regulator
MLQIAEQVRRTRGRPPIRSDEETRRLLIEAAAEEFQANGYAGTCMAAVAQRAGVSTKTVYRLIPNKADLLTRVVSDRIGQFVLEIEPDALDALPLPDALERMLLAYGTLVLSERTIAMHRLVIRECDQFPEVAAAFYEAAIRRANDAMARWMRRQRERGLIALEDPQAAAGMLRGMMSMDPRGHARTTHRPRSGGNSHASETVRTAFSRRLLGAMKVVVGRRIFRWRLRRPDQAR